MNQVILIGNLTADPEKRTTQGGDAVTSFTLAVSRRYKNAQGNYDADFIRCVAWRQTAEFLAQYGVKGRKCAVVGELLTRSYDKDGQKRTVVEVSVNSAEFVTPRQDAPGGVKAGEFVEVKDDSLPF